jgi:hypothetical protein
MLAMLTYNQPWESFGHEDCSEEYHDSSTREIVVDRGTNTIWGRYPLYDLLSLTTTSGTIAITIDPQPADPDYPDKPARVVLQTKSGSIAVSFSSPHAASMPEQEMKMDLKADSSSDKDGQYSYTHNDVVKYRSSCKKWKKRGSYADGHGINGVSVPLPFRPYELEVKTELGSISGRFIFSTSAHIETQSGSISAMFIPVVSSDFPSNTTLTTRTVTGSQSISLIEPYAILSDSETMFQQSGYATSSHTSASGSINIAYPRSWAGTVQATAQAGSICLDGHGLEVTKDGQGHAAAVKRPAEDSEVPEWWGSRGNMNVSLESSESGSINFHVRRH